MEAGDEIIVTDAMVYAFAPLTRSDIRAYLEAEERFLAANPDIRVSPPDDEAT